MLNINTYARQWTEGAIYCYKRGCNCQGCYVKDIIETHCRMKQAVFELVRKFGKPPENKEDRLNDSQMKVINAIIAGCNDKTEIAEYTGLTVTNVQSALSDMYEIAEFDGVVYKNLRYKLPDFINWVRKEKAYEPDGYSMEYTYNCDECGDMECGVKAAQMIEEMIQENEK